MIFAHLFQTASNPPTDVSALESSISALERAIGAVESEVRALENRSVPWEHSVWIFTLLVVVGVALELLVIRYDWRDEMEAWALGHFGVIRLPGKPSLRKRRIEIASVLLITLGVAGELLVGIEITSINGALRGKSAELRGKSDQLVALVTAEAEEAKQENIKLKIALAKLKRTSGWRYLSPDERNQLVKDLSKYVVTDTLIETVQNAEAESFGDDFEAVFARLNWHPRRWSGPNAEGSSMGKRAFSFPPGITIRVVDPSNPPPAALALKRELQNLDFPLFSTIAKAGDVLPEQEQVFKQRNFLELVIGENPQNTR